MSELDEILGGNNLGGMIQFIVLPEVKQEVERYVAREVVKGKRELVAMAEERFENDSHYTFGAWIEDCKEYLNRIENIKVNKDGTISPIDPSKPSEVRT